MTSVDADGLLHPLVVDVHGPGVEVRDDWDGIGQRGTASGTTVYTDVRVPTWCRLDMLRPATGPGFPFLWLILSATQAGIAQSALDEFAATLRKRSRSYEHAASASPVQDPVLQHQIGAAAAQVRALRSVVLGAVPALEAAFDAVPLAAPAISAPGPVSPAAPSAAEGHDDGAPASGSNATAGADATAGAPGSAAGTLDPDAFTAAFDEAWVAAASASSVSSDLALRVTSDLFETAGASAVVGAKHLDRHWRNVRVLASHTPLPHRRRQIGEILLTGSHAPVSSNAVEQPTAAPETTSETPAKDA